MTVSVRPSSPPREAVQNTAHTLLFGPLGSTDVASAVVHRLRAAIGLGLLPEGERLPKEADLADQLGITTFSLREALAELRKQGLIQTRAGKYGGSFVTHAGGEEVERAELLSLSSSELRDLGDWRQMISGQSAALAAVRGSSANVKTLRSYAERVGAAETSLEARRAHGRFHLELASSAQSKRLTRAEFAVHEQIDWLFGLALNTPEAREETAEELKSIADAVARHDAQVARERAEQQVTRLVRRLAHLRLETLATAHPKTPHKDSNLEGEIRALVKTMVRELTAIAKKAAPALSGDMPFPEARARLALAVLQHVDSFPPIVKGIGVNAEVGALPSQPYWIQWWLRTEDGPVEDNHHVMDTSHEDFYDYQFMEYMVRPRESGQPWAHGPYVDYGGVDDYILTISAPALVDGEFRGISLVDVLVADLESWLAPWLVGPDECVLLNGDNRVIVSNSVTHGVGEVLGDTVADKAVTFPEFGWTLLRSATPL